MTDKMKTNNVKLIIDCGVDDFLIESNRELHHRLVYNHIPHVDLPADGFAIPVGDQL